LEATVSAISQEIPPSGDSSLIQRKSLALQHAGAVAFSRTGDPSIGDFQDAAILAQFGEVDLDALSA
jgi:hypothetical protein